MGFGVRLAILLSVDRCCDVSSGCGRRRRRNGVWSPETDRVTENALPFRRPLRNYDITELYNVGFQRTGRRDRTGPATRDARTKRPTSSGARTARSDHRGSRITSANRRPGTRAAIGGSTWLRRAACRGSRITSARRRTKRPGHARAPHRRQTRSARRNRSPTPKTHRTGQTIRRAKSSAQRRVRRVGLTTSKTRQTPQGTVSGHPLRNHGPYRTIPPQSPTTTLTRCKRCHPH